MKRTKTIALPPEANDPHSCNEPDLPDRMLRFAEVCEVLGISSATGWRMRWRGDLPPPIEVAPNCKRWWFSEIKQRFARGDRVA